LLFQGDVKKLSRDERDFEFAFDGLTSQRQSSKERMNNLLKCRSESRIGMASSFSFKPQRQKSLKGLLAAKSGAAVGETKIKFQR